MKEFKEILKKIREEKGISQKKLATILDVKQQAISNWENGKREPDISTLRKFCVIFNVSADELLGIDEKKEQNKIKNQLINNGNFTNNGNFNIS